MENKPTSIIWHHSADPSTEHQAGKINAYHRTRGFPISALGFYGGYHVLIEKDGSIFRFRLDTEIGAHAYNHNQNTLGICLAGNFDIEIPTQAQQTAFQNLLKEKMAIWSITSDRLLPHRALRATACPGHRLYDSWARDILNDPIKTQPLKELPLKHDSCN